MARIITEVLNKKGKNSVQNGLNRFLWGLPLNTYAPRGRGEVKSPTHFHCVLHTKEKEKNGGGGGVSR